MDLISEYITISGFPGDHSIKLSISYALSQSTKLCVFEERVLEIVASTKDLPESLASTGKCTPLPLRLCSPVRVRSIQTHTHIFVGMRCHNEYQ